MITYVDAHDSFSNNIIALLTQLLGTEVNVIKIDDHVENLNLLLATSSAVVIGPGPGHPVEAADIGLIPKVWKLATRDNIPVLGICLGFQTLCAYHKLAVSRLPQPCHGHAKQIYHQDSDIFSDVDGPVLATCYNSLGVLLTEIEDSGTPWISDGCSDGSSGYASPASSISSRPQSPYEVHTGSGELLPLAWDNGGYMMAVRHSSKPQWGVQFHPESCKSNLACHRLIQNWWMAVQKWNRENRVGSITADLLCSTNPKSFSPLHQTQKLDHDILSYLFKLSGKSGSSVQRDRIPRMSGLASSVSELCRKLSSKNSIAMLESTKKGRYNIYAMPGTSTFRIEHRGETLNIYINDSTKASFTVSASKCLELLEKFMLQRRARTTDEIDLLPFSGGYLGYLSYEVGLNNFNDESIGLTAQPDIALLWTERSVVVDHVSGEIFVQSIQKDDHQWIQETSAVIRNAQKTQSNLSHAEKIPARFSCCEKFLPKKTDYQRKIKVCQQQLYAGNSYELCLTAEAQVRIPTGNAWHLYQNLRHSNPVPFAAFLKLGSTTIVSSSPEQFIAWDRCGNIDMVPMKGTVRKSPDVTLSQASQILSSPKEQAENLMIADLIRHDLYSAVGTHANVQVLKLCEVVEHETVYQLVSHIRALVPMPSHLSEDERSKKVIHHGHTALRRSLPPGSMTGAPKKRSCEILADIEGRSRGVYSGVIGYLDVGGGGSFSVCIRSAFSTQDEDNDGMQTWRIGAGGAITVLSDPEEEWNEMQTKLESVMRAFGGER